MKKLNLKDYPKCPKKYEAIFSLKEDDSLYRGCGKAFLITNNNLKIKSIFYLDNFLNSKDFKKEWNLEVKKKKYSFEKEKDKIMFGDLSCRQFLLQKEINLKQLFEGLYNDYDEEYSIDCLNFELVEV